MGLYIRMVLYFLFAGLAGFGIGQYDAQAEIYSISVDQTVALIAPILGFVGTFISSRIAKGRGGAT